MPAPRLLRLNVRPLAGAGTARVPSPARARSLLLCRNTEVLLNLDERALLGVEELRHDRVPATELGDLEQARRSREVARRVSLDDRPVAVVGEDLLGGVGVEEVDERLGLRRVLAVLRDGGRVLDQDRVVRDRVVER